MLASGWARPSRIPGSRHALRPHTIRRTSIISQKCAKAGKVRLEGIEQREGFGGVDKIEVATEANGMTVECACAVVHDFKSRFAIEVRIPAVNTSGECVGQLQVRLCRNRWEIKRPPRVLQTQFVHQSRIDYRRQRSGQRLIAIKIVLECGWQIEA